MGFFALGVAYTRVVSRFRGLTRITSLVSRPHIKSVISHPPPVVKWFSVVCRRMATLYRGSIQCSVKKHTERFYIFHFVWHNHCPSSGRRVRTMPFPHGEKRMGKPRRELWITVIPCLLWNLNDNLILSSSYVTWISLKLKKINQIFCFIRYLVDKSDVVGNHCANIRISSLMNQV